MCKTKNAALSANANKSNKNNTKKKSGKKSILKNLEKQKH